MPALPTTNTKRLVVDYVWRGRPYKTVFRFNEGASLSTQMGIVNAINAALMVHCFDNWSAPGTCTAYSTGNPVGVLLDTLTPRVGLVGGDPGTQPDSQLLQFLGRDFEGRRVSWYWGGINAATNPKQRWHVGTHVPTGGIVAALETAVTNGLSTIGGVGPSIYQYSNVVFNDYLTRQSRGG